MIKDLDRKISFPSADPRDQWPTYYDLLDILYWMKSAMSESGRESSPQLLEIRAKLRKVIRIGLLPGCVLGFYLFLVFSKITVMDS